MPTILKYDEERGKLHRLEQEVLKLKEQVVSLAEESATLQRQKSKLEQELAESRQTRSDTVEEEDMDEFLVVTRPQKFLPNVQKRISSLFKDKQDKSKKGKDPKQQQQQQVQGENTQAKVKRQQLTRQQQQQLLQEQQKQLSLLEEEQIKSNMLSVSATFDKPQGQEVELQSNAADEEEDAKTAKSIKNVITKSQSLDRGDENLEDGEKSGFSIRRAKTLPGRLKTTSLEPPEDKTDGGYSKAVHHEGGDDHKPRPFIFLSQDVYKEHHSAIVHCRFSSSGRMIGSVDADGIVKVWTHHPDIQTFATVMSKSPLLSLEWAPKPDRLLLLGTGNGKVRFYDTENKKTICDVSTESQYPRIVSLSCSPTGGAFVCSAAASKKSMTSSLRFTQSKFSEMSSMLSSSSTWSCAGVLQCWDMKAMRVERQLRLEPVTTCINCTAFNHNGTLCISGGADGMIRLFDMRSFDCLIGWQAHVGEVCSVQFSADETTAYSMGTDGKFSQWSVHRMGQKITDLDIQEGAIWCETENRSKYTSSPSSYGRMFAFDAEGQYVLTCGTESGVIHKVEKNQGLCQVLSLPDHNSPVVSVDWSSSLSCYTCLTGSVDGSIQVTSLLKH